MLDSVKEFFSAVWEVWSEEISVRWRFATVIALIAGPLLGAVVVASWYTKNGCAIHDTSTLLAYGMGGLCLTALFAIVVGLLIGGILHIPDGLRGAVGGLRDWRDEREYNIEYGYNNSPDWDRVKWHVAFWPVLLAVIAGLSLTGGWIVWHFVC